MPAEAPAEAAETSPRGLAEDPAPYRAGDGEPGPAQPLSAGREVIARAVETLPSGPGVYRMINRRGEALYVGKARSLK